MFQLSCNITRCRRLFNIASQNSGHSTLTQVHITRHGARHQSVPMTTPAQSRYTDQRWHADSLSFSMTHSFFREINFPGFAAQSTIFCAALA